MNNLDPSENRQLSGGSKANAVPSVDPGQCFESHFTSLKLSWCPPTWALVTSQKHLWHLRKSWSDKGAQRRRCLALVKATLPYQRAWHLLCCASGGTGRLLEKCLCFLKVHRWPQLLFTVLISSTQLPAGWFLGWLRDRKYGCLLRICVKNLQKKEGILLKA